MDISDLLKYPQLVDVIKVYNNAKKVTQLYELEEIDNYELDIEEPKIKIPDFLSDEDLKPLYDQYEYLMTNFYKNATKIIEKNFDLKDQWSVSSFKLIPKQSLRSILESMHDDLFELNILFKEKNIEENISAIVEYGKSLEESLKILEETEKENEDAIKEIEKEIKKIKSDYEEMLKETLKDIIKNKGK